MAIGEGLKLAGAALLLLAGCATGRVGQVGFIEYPYCSLRAYGATYRFHAEPSAGPRLTAAAARWPQGQVSLTSDNRGVEKDCLDAVMTALRVAGKSVAFQAED